MKEKLKTLRLKNPIAPILFLYFPYLKVKCFHVTSKRSFTRENRWHSICVHKVAWHFQRLRNSVNRYAALCATRCAHPIKISWHFASPSIFDRSGKKAIPSAGKVATRFSSWGSANLNQARGKLRILAPGHPETRFTSAPTKWIRPSLRINPRHPPQNIFSGRIRADTLFLRTHEIGEIEAHTRACDDVARRCA